MERYNRYVQRYTAPINGSEFIYQPVYDPSETERLANILQQRQQRYDVGKQQFADMKAQIGGMQTYAPDLLNKRLEDFTSKVINTVKSDYGGDYGLAVNDIVDLIAKERSDPFYKLNQSQVKYAEDLKQARLKDPENFYEFYKGENEIPLTDQRYLQSALDSGNMAAFDNPQFGYKPNTYELAEKQLENIKPNSIDVIAANWTDAEKQRLAKAGITDVSGLLKGYKEAGINQDRLNELSDSMAKSMLNQTPYFMKKYGNETDAFNAAKKVIEEAAPQFAFTQVDRSIQNIGTGSKKSEEDNLYRPVLTVSDSIQQKPSTSNYDNANKLFSELDLDSEYKSRKLASLEKKLLDLETKEAKAEGGVGLSAGIRTNIANTKKQINELKKSGDIEDKKIYSDWINKINDFELNYKDINTGLAFPNDVKTNKDKALFISKLEDKYLNQNYSLISPTNFNKTTNFVNDMNWQLNELGAVEELEKFDHDNNKWTSLDRSESKHNFDLSSQIKNVDIKDFKVQGIDPYNAKLRAVGGKNNAGNIAYYPSEQAQHFGERIAKSSNEIKTKGFSLDRSGQIYGYPTLSIKTYDKNYPYETDGSGAFTEVVVQIPQQFYEKVKNVKNKNDAEQLLNELRLNGISPINRRSFLTSFIDQNAESLGYLTKRK